MSNISQLNSAIIAEQNNINEQYLQIGKLYMDTHADDCEPAFAQMVSAIKDSLAKIDDYCQQIDDIKGVMKCPVCGAEVSKEAAFCTTCGAQLAKVEEPAPAAEPAFEPIPVAEPVTQPEVAVEAAIPALACTVCGQPIDEGTKFCTNCGTPVPAEAFAPAAIFAEEPAPVEEAVCEEPVANVVTCAACGQPIEEGTKFCTNCGTPVPAEAFAPAAIPVEEVAPQPVEEFVAPVTEPIFEPIPVAEPVAEPEAVAVEAAIPALTCAACGQPIDEGTKFCTNCGTPVVAPAPEQAVEEEKGVACANCGAHLAEGTKFCTNCGTPVEAPAVAAEPKCPTCGADVISGSSFCVQCGTRL